MALIYELTLIPAIFGLGWIGSGLSGNFVDWIELNQQKWTHVQLCKWLSDLSYGWLNLITLPSHGTITPYAQYHVTCALNHLFTT